MRRTLAIIAGLFGITAAVLAARSVYIGPLVNESALAYNKNYTLNAANYGIDSLSATASYSSATATSQTFTDGTQSTGSITVATLTGLAGTQGTDSLTVLSSNSLAGSSIAVGGKTLTESIQWYTQTSTNSVATSLKNAINTGAPQFTASIGAQKNKVTITCGSSGTWCNNQTLAVVGTSSITAAAANFSGGVDNGMVAINNVALSQGSGTGRWAVGVSSAATANALAAAINANSSLSSIITSTAPLACGLANGCGVVKLTSIPVGTAQNYSLYSSSQTALTLDGVVTATSDRGYGAMRGGTNAGYTINSANITIANNPFYSKSAYAGQASMVGLPVLYSGSVAIGGLTTQTTYYVIPVDANTIKLASSSTNAQAGTGITLTSSSTQTTAHTYTLAPLAIAGTPSFKWQVSNDGNLWQDFTASSSGVSISSVTVLAYTNGGASTSWDFGPFGYQYIRLAVLSPTAGGLNLLVTMNGKNNSNR